MDQGFPLEMRKLGVASLWLDSGFVVLFCFLFLIDFFFLFAFSVLSHRNPAGGG